MDTCTWRMLFAVLLAQHIAPGTLLAYYTSCRVGGIVLSECQLFACTPDIGLNRPYCASCTDDAAKLSWLHVGLCKECSLVLATSQCTHA
jgi:hypothetical protein